MGESPMVVGPRQLTKPVCLGCHKEITPTTPWKPCVRCHWPVCSPACQDSPAHDAECRATKAAGSRVKVEHFGQINMMYRTACIMSHHCRPNTRHTFDPDNSINIYSTRRIKKGETISATYTNSLWSTNDRREHLKMSKCFWCECERCTDPTEFGSY